MPLGLQSAPTTGYRMKFTAGQLYCPSQDPMAPWVPGQV